MNKTSFKSLDISKEEISAVQRYISSAHIDMNSLLDIDPEVLLKLKDKGWFIDFSKEGIEINVEYLAKLYSAMYKSTKQRESGKIVVYRGTSIDEVNKLKRDKISGRFLSTTTDRDIAMRFTEYQRGAMIDMSINSDLPYIVADEFLDETQISESEILVSPFSNISDIQPYGVQNIQGVSRYSAKINKEEFENISEEERKVYEDTIYSFDFETELKKYKELTSKLYIITSRIEKFGIPHDKDESEDLAYMREQQSKLSLEASEARKHFEKVKMSMNAILQDRFKTIELGIDRGLEQDKLEFEKEERKRKIELERERKKILISNVEETLTQIELAKLSYSSKDSEEDKIYSIAEKLGLDTSNICTVDLETLDKFEQLKRNVENLKNEIESIQIPDNLTNEEMLPSTELNKKINELYDKLGITMQVLNECNKAIVGQKSKNKAILDRRTASSIGEKICTEAKEYLLKQEQDLVSKKDSLWDKITGKAKIKAAQVQNLKLRRQFIEKGGLKLPDNVEEMQMYMNKYVSVIGANALSEHLKSLLPGQTIEAQITNEEQEIFEILKPQVDLVPTGKTRKEVLDILEKQNSSIEVRMQYEDVPRNDKSIPNLEKATKNTVERCLDTAIFYTSELTEEQRERCINDQITL